MGSKESVLTSAGREVGTLKSVEGEMLHLRGRDYWLPVTAIETIDEKAVKLRPDFDYLAGPKQGGKAAKGVVSGMTRLAMLGLIARTAYTYRDERKRKDLVEKAKGIADRAKTEINRAKAKRAGGSGTDWTIPSALTSTPDISPFSMANTPPVASTSTPSTRPFSSLDLSDRTVTATEVEVIAEVTQAFPGDSLRVNAVAVHKEDGSEVGTLRFTVDENASTDLDLSRLEAKGAHAGSLAKEVITDLKAQMPLEN